jgi:hypothetical protein
MTQDHSNRIQISGDPQLSAMAPIGEEPALRAEQSTISDLNESVRISTCQLPF